MPHTGRVSTKEQLHLLVDALPDEQAPRALALLRAIATEAEPTARRVLPRSLGVGASGRGDVSERVDELLTEGFGR